MITALRAIGSHMSVWLEHQDPILLAVFSVSVLFVVGTLWWFERRVRDLERGDRLRQEVRRR